MYSVISTLNSRDTELDYINNDVQTVNNGKCLYQTPEVVGRMVKINCSAAYLTDQTCDEFIIGYIIDRSTITNEYIVEIPELAGRLHNCLRSNHLKFSGRKYWYCDREWFEFVD